MKKIKYLLIALIFVITGCANSSEQDSGLNIISTIFPSYDFAKNISADFADVRMLLPPGGEVHSFEPSPKDIISIQNADIFIYTGGESDVWIDDILSTLDLDKTKIIKMTDICPTDDVHDEHVWTAPQNAVEITKEISKAICEADPQNEKIYKENTDNYINRLKALDDKFRAIVEEGKRNTIIFADRFPIKHFTDSYNLKYYSAFSGCAQETEADIKTVTALIDKVKEEEIPAVFYIEFSNHKLADEISKQTGAKTLLFHTCHNVSKKEFEDGISYIDLMNNNAEALREALN